MAKQVLYFTALAFIMGIYEIYGQALYNYSITFIEQLQPHMSDPKTAFFLTFSTIGETFTYFTIMLIVYSYSGNAKGFYYLFEFCVLVTFTNFTKIAYHEPRPYMSSDYITAIHCSHEFGNASGHSIAAAGFTVFYFLDYFHSERVTSKVKYFSALICTMTYIFLVGCARIYQGLHSFDQVIYGWQLGVWTACYFHFCLRTPLLKHLNSLADDQQLKVNYRKNISYATVLCMIGFLAQIIAFYVVDSNFTVPNEWNQRLIQKCGEQPKNKTYHYKSMAQAGNTIGGYFGYLGILAFRYFFGLASNQLFKTEISKFLLRAGIAFLIALPFIILNAVIHFGDSSLWIPLIFKFMIPTGGAYFSLFLFGIPTFRKFKLLADKSELDHDNEQKQPLIFNDDPQS